MLLSRYPATLLRVVDGFHDGVYHKALVVGSIGGAAGGKRQDMAAAPPMLPTTSALWYTPSWNPSTTRSKVAG